MTKDVGKIVKYAVHTGVAFLLGWGTMVLTMTLWYNLDRPDVLSAEVAEVSPPTPRHSPFADKLTPLYEDPVGLYAEDANDRTIVKAPLVKVDVDSSGQLEAPKEWDKVGWYRRSAKTGEEGNVLLNGHYDDNYGRPAAFYNLKSLKVNDKVYLVDSFGREFSYQVTQIFYVSIYDEDRVKKVMESDGSSLTLITCGGFWAPSEGTYNSRLVVKAQRIENR